jgi:hypothetical protein
MSYRHFIPSVTGTAPDRLKEQALGIGISRAYINNPPAFDALLHPVPQSTP